MKHAGPDALDQLEPMLTAIRETGLLRERRRGTFESRGRMTLHFHEDPTGFYADLRVLGETTRLRVSTAAERRRLLAAVRRGHKRATGAPVP